MTHQQILNKLAFSQLSQAIDEDLARLVIRARALRKGGSITDISSYVLPKILTRWNCVLLAENGLAEFYKEKVALTLAILLHKYGFSDKEIIQKAIFAIDVLNDEVVLSDDFNRKSDQIKDFITTIPKTLKRAPSQPENITFYRAKDVISINIDSKYYVAYIHELTGVNESPVIEFYNKVFNKKPKIEDMSGLKAKGQNYNDGTTRKSYFAVYGMKYQPDLANQIHLMKSCHDSEMLPENGHLEEAIGLYAIMDLFNIQDVIRKMFSE